MKALSSMATRHVLADMLAAAADDGLPTADLESVGGVDAAARVAAGEDVDLLLLEVGALQRLADQGHVDGATVTPLMRSQVAVAVPSGTAAPASFPAGVTVGPAFGSADGVREALRTASRIGLSTGPSGIALRDLIEDWGLGAELAGRLVQARPGVPVAASLAEGSVDLGFQQLSELVGEPGVRILGVLPPDCAIDTVFGGAVVAGSAVPDDAGRVLSFLSSARAADLTRGHSFAAP